MGNFIHGIYHIARILNQKKPITVKHKLGTLFAYLRMKFKKTLLVDVLKLNPQHEYFLGLYVHCYSYAQLVSLFEDIFIREEYFFQSSKSRPFIIDGGSHIGMSVLYFKYLYPQAVICAFEPDPDTFTLLSRNIFVNHLKDITLVNKALSGNEAKAKFYYDDKLPGSTVMSLLPTRYHTAYKNVSTTVLSSHIKKPVDLLKLDVEGAETVVISDLARKKKLKFISTLYIEYHHHISKTADALSKFIRLLEDNNFSYQFSIMYKPPFKEFLYQDIVIYAAKK